MEGLKIVATIVANVVAKDTVYEVMKKLVVASRKEEGCISYDLYRDIAMPNKFVVIEHWKSQDAINIHNETDHYKCFGVDVEGMLETVEISVLEMVY